MPKPTFWNLPAEKRELLHQIALEEFAAHDYQNASVSHIVARMGIAKGSLYQYFEDKQDLFLYLLDDAQRTLLVLLQKGAQPAGGFFELLRAQMSATVRAALAYPLQSQLIQRAYGQSTASAALPFRSEVIESGRQARAGYLRALVEAGIAAGELDTAVSIDVAVLMVSGVVSEIGPYLIYKLGAPDLARTLDQEQLNNPLIEATFDAVIAALCSGLGARK